MEVFVRGKISSYYRAATSSSASLLLDSSDLFELSSPSFSSLMENRPTLRAKSLPSQQETHEHPAARTQQTFP
eukprot:scaffold13050_cov103-Skeletonema_dohrnii-CCMP3373.AAC.1